MDRPRGFPPKDLISLAETVDRLGRKLFGPEWTGEEEDASDGPAEERRAKVIDQLRRWFLGEQNFFQFVFSDPDLYDDKSGRVVGSIDRDVWRGENCLRIFGTGRYNDLFVMVGEPFINRALDSIQTPRSKMTAWAENECYKDLKQQMSASPERRPRLLDGC